MPIKKIVTADDSNTQGGGFFKGVVVVIIIAIIAFGTYYILSDKQDDDGRLVKNAGEWQAVFLTNGQVYFGKVTNESERQIVMEDIYYLQVVQSLQQSADEGEEPTPQNELSLVKLGNELHAPTDKMRINRDHVMIIEDLRADSQVIEAISRYQQNQQNQPVQQQPAQPIQQPAQ